jgi:proline racemase
MNSFWAMNSLRMSFWIVPDRRCQSAPCRSATTRYMAKITAAGELIVIDVVTSASAIPSNSRSMSASVATLTPHLPTSPSDRS